MANLGFKLAMERDGHRAWSRRRSATATCSRRCAQGGYVLGGEQSGHVIMLDHATTGDGILTGLHLLARVAETGKALAELADVMQQAAAGDGERAGRGQVARRVRHAELAEAVAAAEAELGETGRVLLRPSGTEPLVRVMVEAESQDQADTIAHRLADVVSTALA